MKKGCNFWAISSNKFPLEDKALQPPWGEKDSTKFPQKSWNVSLQNLGPFGPKESCFGPRFHEETWLPRELIPHICLEKF